VSAPVLELSDVSKEYRGLRPLRIARLLVAATDQIAIVGLDRAAAEVFVNLVTGTTLPDVGEVRLFGRPTTAIADSADSRSFFLRLLASQTTSISSGASQAVNFR